MAPYPKQMPRACGPQRMRTNPLSGTTFFQWVEIPRKPRFLAFLTSRGYKVVGFTLQHILRYSSGRLTYRRVVPEDLRRFVPGGGREFKRSLELGGSRGCLARYEEAGLQYQRLVEKCCDGSRVTTCRPRPFLIWFAHPRIRELQVGGCPYRGRLLPTRRPKA